jgi:hypothetical protein
MAEAIAPLGFVGADKDTGSREHRKHDSHIACYGILGPLRRGTINGK